MQPQQPGQPPQQPAPPPNNYDFIMNPGDSPKKTPLGGSSMATRILVVVGGLFLLIIVAAVFMSFIGGAGKSFDNAAMLTVAQDQTELQRLSDLGVQESVEQTNKNFSATTKLGIKSDQSTLLSFLAQNGYTIDPKQLPLKQDAAATTQLENAKSASKFDSTYETVMKRALQAYQTDLRTAYEGSEGEAKQVLNTAYENVTLLLTQLDAGN